MTDGLGVFAFDATLRAYVHHSFVMRVDYGFRASVVSAWRLGTVSLVIVAALVATRPIVAIATVRSLVVASIGTLLSVLVVAVFTARALSGVRGALRG